MTHDATHQVGGDEGQQSFSRWLHDHGVKVAVQEDRGQLPQQTPQNGLPLRKRCVRIPRYPSPVVAHPAVRPPQGM